MHISSVVAGSSLAFFIFVASVPAHAQATLVQFASLPADTFTPGPTSGQFIMTTNGRVPPFDNRQPVQGISSVLRASNGDFLVMSDNGFGGKENSPDYVLRVYRISPDFRTKNKGSGTIQVESFITLSDQRRLIINEFDVTDGAYTGRQWFYRLDSAAYAIGDFTAVTPKRFLVIERDNLEGPAAAFKKIVLVDLDDVDSDGFLVKHQVADLLEIRDPDNIGRHGDTFRFPFQTIESVIPFNAQTLGVLDDNNYPFSNGRVAGQPDPNEFIVIRLDRPLVE